MTIPFEPEKLLKIKSIKLETSRGETIELQYHQLKLKITQNGLCFTYEESFMPLCRGDNLLNLFKKVRKNKK